MEFKEKVKKHIESLDLPDTVGVRFQEATKEVFFSTLTLGWEALVAVDIFGVHSYVIKGKKAVYKDGIKSSGLEQGDHETIDMNKAFNEYFINSTLNKNKDFFTQLVVILQEEFNK